LADSAQATQNGEQGSTPKQRQPPFVLTLYRFQETIDAVRQIHEEVCGHAAELDRQRISPEQLSAVKSLDPERQEKFKHWLARTFEKAHEKAEGAGEEGKGGSPSEEATLDDDEKRLMAEVFGDNPVAIGQAQALLQRNLLVAPSREMLLRSSLLTMAVSAFEVLLGNLIARHYELHPAGLGDEKRFSLKQIAGYDSLEDVQDAAIAFRVYQLLQARLDDWAKWFDQGSGLGLKLSNLAISYDELEETIQRRHVIVHNGGAVSAQYLERVSTEENALPVGAPLPVTDQYLEKALDHLDSLGNLLGVCVWAKDRPDAKEEAISVLVNRMEQLLFTGRWLALRQVSSYGKKIAPLDVHQQIFKVNEWLAIKRLDGLDSIEEKIRDWDTSALGPHFQLVQPALLGDADAFYALAPEIYREGGIQSEQLLTWPVFEEMRADSRFVEMIGGEKEVDSIG
jgi:hypothetical protein